MQFSNSKLKNLYKLSLETIFANNYKSVYKVAYTFMQDKFMAEDATQEAFILAFRNINNLKEKDKFKAWIITIVTNVCRKLIKEKRKNIIQSVPLENYENSVDDICGDTDYNISEELYEQKEFMIELLICLDTLPEKDRQILILKMFNDLSYSEIASILDMTESAIKMRAIRAKGKIKDKIETLLSSRESAAR